MDGKEDIASYIERIELCFAANYVEKDNEVVTLLAVIGAFLSKSRIFFLS